VASFTAAGTYVLELAATDGDLSAGDAVTVTVSLPGGGSFDLQRLVQLELTIARGTPTELTDE